LGQEKFADAFVPLRVMADGQHVKVYMGDTRVANVPNADLGRAKEILVKIPATVESPAMIGAIRVAAGGRKLYDALAEKGRVATQGIYFASGAADILPQSTPTLKEIAQMLAEHPDLTLEVEGHTDNVGDDASNQALSERRAQAVVAYLVSTGVDASRLTAKGYGESRPVASNATAEGRAANRRVELVKPGAKKASAGKTGTL
jgi:outer membrane protein OmpA-like peptidoglycan-associated protein